MEVTTHSTQETKELAEQLALKAKPKSVYALYGDLGSGKTTFTRYFTNALGFDSRVQSPTFVIVRNYIKTSGEIKKIYHIDLYRLHTKELVDDIGLEEMYEDASAITIIEWPDILDDLPKDTVKIYFEHIDDSIRKIKINE